MNCIFVILHYLTLNDTIEAIDSIKKYEPESHVVVVDNASNNGSYEELVTKFEKDKLVDIILAPSNLGFAKGNNLGIKYARKHFPDSFICVMNNDVLLIEKICLKINNEFNDSNFTVLGPMIYTADGRCDDNPGTSKPMNKLDLKAFINYRKRIIFFNSLRLGKVQMLLGKIKRMLKNDKLEIEHKNYLERVENVQLHGSFLVLSPTFFDVFEGLYPGTFLYLEEDILFWQLQKEKLKTVYSPVIHIFHKEDSASKKVWPKERKRVIAQSKNILKSAYAFEKLMNNVSETTNVV